MKGETTTSITWKIIFSKTKNVCPTNFSFETTRTANNMIKYVFSNVSIHGTEGIVKVVYISPAVYSSRQTDPLFLSSREVYTLKFVNIKSVSLLYINV